LNGCWYGRYGNVLGEFLRIKTENKIREYLRIISENNGIIFENSIGESQKIKKRGITDLPFPFFILF